MIVMVTDDNEIVRLAIIIRPVMDDSYNCKLIIGDSVLVS
jgi:hypothetical protein